METEHIPVRNWIARLRHSDGSEKEIRIPVKGVDIIEASKDASEEATCRFAWVAGVEVLE